MITLSTAPCFSSLPPPANTFSSRHFLPSSLITHVSLVLIISVSPDSAAATKPVSTSHRFYRPRFALLRTRFSSTSKSRRSCWVANLFFYPPLDRGIYLISKHSTQSSYSDHISSPRGSNLLNLYTTFSCGGFDPTRSPMCSPPINHWTGL